MLSLRSANRWISATLFTVAITALAGALVTLGERHHARIDLTASGSHKLGDRAQAVVDQLTAPIEIVAALQATPDRARVNDRVGDVLDAFDSDSDLVSVTRVDLGKPESGEAVADLITRLTERERVAIDAGRLEVVRGVSSVRSIAGELLAVILNTDRNRAALLRAFATELGRFAGEAEALLDVPSTAALNPRAAAEPLLVPLRTLAERLDQESAALNAQGNAALAGTLADIAGSARATRDRLLLIPTTDVSRLAAELASGEAVIVLGDVDRSVSLAPIDTAQLAPNERALRALGVTGLPEITARAEELLTSGVAAVSRNDAPIVVITHAEVSASGQRLGTLIALSQRLRGRGVDLFVWHVPSSPEPPSFAAVDPDGTRPVVFMAFSPDSSESLRGETASGAVRAQTLADALAVRLDAGDGVLLSVGPSYLETIGGRDPLAELADRYGVEVASGTTVLGDVVDASGRQIVTATRATAEGDHPVALAVGGLPVALDWAVPLGARSRTGVRADVVLGADPGDRAWAETRWLGIWRTPEQARAALPSLPEFDEETGDARGPFGLAAASEIDLPTGGASRLVVVGASAWASDRWWAPSQQVAGRLVRTNPGNIELIEASIEWLAGRDELVGQSAAAAPISRVGPITPERFGLLRWILLAAVPGGVLGLWLVFRLLAG
ncbi:MAG: hypothetical protein AAGI17_09930 [Planctomycetota bacterium]